MTFSLNNAFNKDKLLNQNWTFVDFAQNYISSIENTPNIFMI